MAVRPKNGTWMVDFMVAGTRYREFAFASEQEAGAWEAEAREAVKRGQPLPYKGPTRITGASWGPKPGRCLTMRELVRHCAKVHWSSRKSADKLIHNADLFADFHGPETLAQDALSARGVSDYVLSLQDRGRCGSTVNRHLSSVSVLAKHGLALNALTVLPLLPWQREAEGRLRWFTDAEEAAILATLADWGQERYRDFFIFLADTGARVGEAGKFDWECIGGNGRLVTFWETKNGNHRTVPMTTRVREAVQRRRIGEPGSKGPFASVNTAGLRGVWSRLRAHYPFLRDAVPHTYRHTCASRLVQRGIELVRVKEWMGHKALTTTLRYAHLSPKHLDEAMEALERAG